MERRKEPSRYSWIIWIFFGLFVLIMSGLGVKSYESSQVVGHEQYRFNMAIIAPASGVTFVSFDPAEKSILALPFPSNLAIKSRSSGEYSIASLYKLGSYKGSGGMFARQKIQGFMRVPIPGYIVVKNEKGEVKGVLTKSLLKTIFGHTETSLSRFDAMLLLYRTNRYSAREIDEKELIRAGIIEGTTYHSERLQEYVGTRLFDWGIGATGVTVSIVNGSGENGLGSDMADFLTNLGLDVVTVKSVFGNETLETSEWQVGSETQATELAYIFQNLFGFDKPRVEKMSDEYRSTVLIRVGKDAKELF